jgi:hypothetical protein
MAIHQMIALLLPVLASLRGVQGVGTVFFKLIVKQKLISIVPIAVNGLLVFEIDKLLRFFLSVLFINQLYIHKTVFHL